MHVTLNNLIDDLSDYTGESEIFMSIIKENGLYMVYNEIPRITSDFPMSSEWLYERDITDILYPNQDGIVYNFRITDDSILLMRKYAYDVNFDIDTVLDIDLDNRVFLVNIEIISGILAKFTGYMEEKSVMVDNIKFRDYYNKMISL
jgi:hypothetical protein